MSTTFRLPQVKFRMDIVAFGESRTKLLELYKEKLGTLMREALDARLNSLDYEDLPALREAIRKNGKLQDISSVVFKQVGDVKFKVLLDAAPIFNVCPIEMRAFVLLALGVRSAHMRELE